MKKKLIGLIILLLIVITTIITQKTLNQPNQKENTNINNTLNSTTQKINNLSLLKATNQFIANNLQIIKENEIIYLTLNNKKYNLDIPNTKYMFAVKQKMSSFFTIYILTANGSLYSSSLSTIKEYKNEEIDTIKQNFSLKKIDRIIINLYKDEYEKIVYEDNNNTYYYLSDNSLY